MAPVDRSTYAETVSGLLTPGGRFFLKTFSVNQPGNWGPYRLAPADIEALFSAALEIITIKETVFHGTLKKVPKALFAVMRRR